MFSRVDGSMATAARAANGRARAGVPAVLATRCCRKDEPKRTGGNTGNTGNPLAGIRRARFVNDIRRFGVPADGRFAPDGLAEMGGNWRKLLECITSAPNRGYDGGGMEKGSE